ncbi:hypothetical protein QCN29_35580 [Streptomyces sp. HNM0663]|uniref:Uncharacterized protein n=1 Tax=Streptomyces chengmaiensis TaxID=3040919 RepID=A0ABT6HZ41_9ACTN|nr:hypothetical protein [Streptomyces chengmaiensis]MDH2393981.1 hypothetical protein [Streptomyces chengmaiensis]
MTSAPSPPPASEPPSPDAEPLLAPRTVLILLAAAFIGAIVGVLTFLSAGDVAGALLAGLAGAGASTLGLHRLIGH